MSGPKKPKVDPASPFAKLKAMKDKLAAEEAAAKAARSEQAAGAGAGKGASGPRPAASSSGSARTKPPRVSAEDDALAFHRLVSGVTPLERGSQRIPRSQHALDTAAAAEQAKKRAAAQASVEQEAQAVHEHLRALVEGGSRFEVTDDGHRVEGRRATVTSDQLRQLRRGALPIDARLDLHGLRAGEAREQVEAFLRDKRARGERCVLVVHGKGEHSPSGLGILRGEISAWLSQSRASEHVGAFATAIDVDGGEGAVYVLLRR